MKAGTAWLILRTFGVGWVGFRLKYALRQRLGMARRALPAGQWDDYPLDRILSDPTRATDAGYASRRAASAGRFFFQADDRSRVAPTLRAFDDNPGWPEQRLREIASGRLRYFSGQVHAIGWPPRWHTNAATGEVAPADVHFSAINEFANGDVKVIWEPNRFGFVYDLARIAWRGDEDRADRCAAMFWAAVEDWADQNPPNTGINWKCGQEASLRAMAWAFGLYAFGDRPTTTPARQALMAKLMAVTARRVDANIDYALSQKNNHAVSEAMGLFTIGLLWPELRHADRWRGKGRRLLDRLARELIYDDGGFTQHSANYQRVMLQDYLWAIRLGQYNDQPLSRAVVERVGRSGRMLEAMQDPRTGRVPRFGQDDGALVLPLTNCDYADYRPTLQTVRQVCDGVRSVAAGGWDEMALWLCGADALATPVQKPRPAHASFPRAGCHVLRRGDAMAMLRCADYQHRPTQLDQLHVDIWHAGHNLALDAGTYSYNATGPWASVPLASAVAHNTVTVDGADQAAQLGRFLYLPWPSGRLTRFERSARDQVAIMVGEHAGYARLDDPVTHRRAVVQLGATHWLVIDDLRGRRRHAARLHWLLADLPHRWDAEAARLTFDLDGEPYAVQVAAAAPMACDVVRGQKDQPRGWYAPRYQQLFPALSLAATVTADAVRFVTAFGPGEYRLHLDARGLTMEAGAWSAELVGADASATASIVKSVTLSGALSDALEM